MNGQAPPSSRAQELAERAHRAARERHRAVAGAPAEPRPRPADLLLGDHDRVERAPRDLHPEAAELADRVAHARRTARGARGRGTRRRACCPASSSAIRHRITSPGGRRPAAFARMNAASIIATPPFMSSAPRPHTKPSCSSPANGGCRHVPVRRDHVDVALQQQRRRGALARQPRDQVRALGLGPDDPHLAAELLEQAAHPLDALALVARRVGRVEAQQPRQELVGRSCSAPRRGEAVVLIGAVSPIASLQRWLRAQIAGNTTDDAPFDLDRRDQLRPGHRARQALQRDQPQERALPPAQRQERRRASRRSASIRRAARRSPTRTSSRATRSRPTATS